MKEEQAVSVTLKWSKQTFPLTIRSGESGLSLKQRIESLTGVPVARQKLLAKSAWKGPLKDDDAINNKLPSSITLIGSADTLTGPTQTTTFVEDLTEEQLRAAEQAQMEASAETATGMITALQMPPHLRDDKKQEVYSYNRLVTGLPQRQIEHMLQLQTSEEPLQGKVAMTLGLELRRAYVNDLAVLPDGTLVSANDDGHVQLWKHGALQDDVIHPGGGGDGGVDSVVALLSPNKKTTTTNDTTTNIQSHVAFATAGRGYLQLWTAEAEPALAVPSAVPGTSLDSLVSFSAAGATQPCLAARFRVVRQSNPMQFRLPPQNDAERQRRALARAQEEAVQQALARAARSIEILWFSDNNNTLQSQILEPDESYASSSLSSSSAPVTCMTAISQDDGNDVLVVGDASGGLRFWRVRLNNINNNGGLEFHQEQFHQLVPSMQQASSCSIVCLQTLANGLLAVSTTETAQSPRPLPGASAVAVPLARATTLNGHGAKDAVICMCQLPNGALLTGGGKMDATLQLWTSAQLEKAEEQAGREVQEKANKTLSDVGYVFCLAVLPDSKQDSSFFAVAAARYNTVKLFL